MPAPAADATPAPPRVRVPAGRVAAVAARPGFVVGHLVVIALAVTTVLLGRWQWHVAHVHASSLQNYAYAFQWWIFCAFGIAMWLRIMRDRAARDLEVGTEAGAAVPSAADRLAAREDAATRLPAGYRPYVMPSAAQLAGGTPPTPVLDPAAPGDDVLARYNADLARRSSGVASPP